MHLYVLILMYVRLIFNLHTCVNLKYDNEAKIWNNQN